MLLKAFSIVSCRRLLETVHGDKTGFLHSTTAGMAGFGSAGGAAPSIETVSEVSVTDVECEVGVYAGPTRIVIVSFVILRLTMPLHPER